MNKKNIFMLTLSVGLYLTACNNSAKTSDSNTGNNDTSAASAEKQPGTANKPIDKDDSTFMAEVASGGMMEVQAGQIALNRGASKDVKQFAQRMVTDHSRLDSQLTALAAQKNVVLPTSLNSSDRKNVDKLNKVDIKDFDKTYMDMMVDGHKSTVEKFQDEVKNAKDADLKAWVQQTLPILQQHLDMALAAQAIVDKAHKNS